MTAEKFGGAAGNGSGGIVHELAIILKESVITPIITVDATDSTQVAILLQLPSATGKSRYKAQAMHLLWGFGRGKYTPFMEKLRNNVLEGNNNYPTTVLDVYRLLLRHLL